MFPWRRSRSRPRTTVVRRRGRLTGRPARPWLRRLLWVVAVLVALPHAILLVYRVIPPPFTPLMVVRLADGQGFSRNWVPIEDMAPSLVHAVIAAEDNRFCTHRGVDWTEMRSAAGDYWSDARVRGASTITMQTVKNLLLWQRQHVVRKGLEVYFAHYLELIWPKRRIVEVYLNIAEWGPGVYGADAAARRWFNTPAARLSPAEASLLAAALPSPLRWRPDRPTEYLANRAVSIQRRVEQLGPLLDCAVSDAAGSPAG